MRHVSDFSIAASRSRAFLLTLTGGVFIASAAQAFCPPCTAMPFVTAQNTAITAALTLMNQAIVAAVNTHGGGTAGSKSGEAAAHFEAAKSEAGMINSGTMVATYRKANLQSVVNPQSLNCRLQTMNNVSSAIATKFEQSVAYNLQDGVINLFFNRNFTPDRTHMASMQRNCKNGQLLRADMGDKWWNAVNTASPATSQCFEDATDADGDGVSDFAHAFIKPSTITDHKVLVPPTNAQMDILNNPDSGNPQTTWNALNKKQKLYVSAVRFCENLALTALKPLGIYGDAALNPNNMPVVLQNFSAIAKLDALIYACRSELARRTAPADPSTIPGMLNAATDTDVKADSQKVANFLLRLGPQLSATGEAEEFQDRDAGGNLVSYMSPAMLSYAKYEAFCSSTETLKSISADSGLASGDADALKASNMVKCENIKMVYHETENIYRSLFNNMVGGIGRLGGQFSGGLPAPVRADAGGIIHRASFAESRRPWSGNAKLVDMLRNAQ